MTRQLHGPAAIVLATLLLLGGFAGQLGPVSTLVSDIGLVAIVAGLAVLAVALPWASARAEDDESMDARPPRR